jgi:hypothetical protein
MVPVRQAQVKITIELSHTEVDRLTDSALAHNETLGDEAKRLLSLALGVSAPSDGQPPRKLFRRDKKSKARKLQRGRKR